MESSGAAAFTIALLILREHTQPFISLFPHFSPLTFFVKRLKMKCRKNEEYKKKRLFKEQQEGQLIICQRREMGKIILVTGASRGIGLQLVKTIIEKDDECVIYGVARTEASLQSLQKEYGADKFMYRACDITDRSQVEALVEEIRNKHGKLDSIVANAGMLEPVKSISQATSEHDIKQWERLFDVNFFSIVTLVTLCLPLLKGSPFVSNIVFVSSGASVKPYNGWSAYGCSKAALNHFAMDIASEEPSDKVRAVCIAPGVVDTQMQKDIRETLGPQGMTPEALERFTQLYKTSSLLDPKVPAAVLAQLALKGIPDALNGQYLRYNDERLGPVQG